MNPFALILFIFTLSFSSVTLARLIDGIVATVNSEVILKSDLSDLEQRLKNDDILDDLPLGGLSINDLKKDAKARLQYLIRAKMLDGEVKRLKLEVTIERVEQELREIARRNGISRDQLPKVMAQQGVTFSEYQDYLKTRLERQSFVDQEIASRLRIADEDIMGAYFAKFKRAPSTSFEVELSHIFFSPKTGGASEAKSRAESALAKLYAGQTFESVAQQFSEESNFKNKGFLGAFKKDDLEASLAQAIEKHPGTGVIQEIVRTRSGFHIFNVLSRKDSPDPDYLKRKDQLRAELFETQMRLAIDRWFEQKQSEFTIQINDK